MASRSTTSFLRPSPARSSSQVCTADTLFRPRKGANDPLKPIEQARRIADLAQNKLAKDVTILDMRPVCTYTDYFVICTGQNPRQTKAIYDEVRDRLKAEERLIPRNVDGEGDARWILVDYLDVVLHVFTPEARDFYRLEELWGDVPSIEVAAAH